MGKGTIERIHPGVQRDVVDRCKAFFGSKEYLFESPNGGSSGDHRYSPKYVSTLISRMGKKIFTEEYGDLWKDRKISAHCLRHTRATLL